MPHFNSWVPTDMTLATFEHLPQLDSKKFQNPDLTADGDARAHVDYRALDTLWFNTGSLCNLTCTNCYIESSPTNDRLAYLGTSDIVSFLDEIDAKELPTREIGLTGGEPFMNPSTVEIMDLILGRGFELLVLSNGMRPMMKVADDVAALNAAFPDKLTIRVSLDHYRQAEHDSIRGEHAWARTFPGVKWIIENKIKLTIAGRTQWDEDEASLRRGFKELFASLGLPVDAADPAALVLFPEMDETQDVPEITTACWGLLSVDPARMMCATSRMVVKRKGAEEAVVLPCTLLPYDPQFEMGTSLEAASAPVSLNHPHCARFCVLGGGSCST